VDTKLIRSLTKYNYVRALAGRKSEARRMRHSVQAAFVLLNVWLFAQFFLSVRHFETSGITRQVERPVGVEGWLPVASLSSSLGRMKPFIRGDDAGERVGQVKVSRSERRPENSTEVRATCKVHSR
jgi:hypothetical protein